MCLPQASLAVPLLLRQDSTGHKDPILSLLIPETQHTHSIPTHERVCLYSDFLNISA